MARILLIDDEEAMRDIMVRGLQIAGHVVTAAKDGREGARLFETQLFDLVITDIVMPDQDGLEVIGAVRKARPEMPIIAMSGTSLHSGLYLRLAQQLGAQRVLAKPFPLATLIQVVAEVLAGPA